MHPPPFDRPGRFFRGNLHTHSTRSDGHAEPQEVVDAYRAAGHDFLVLSDHFEAEWGWTVTDTRPLRTAAFTTILGAEFSSADWDAQDVFWVVAAGLPPDFAAPAPGEPHDHAIRRAAEAGAFNILLHPGLTNFLAFDNLPVQYLDAVETYNHSLALVWPDQAEGRYAVDALLTRGCRLNITASDDAHWNNPWDRFGAWVEARADSLTPQALLTALKEGAYYSTQGPRITDVRVEDGLVNVACTPVRSVVLSGAHGMRSEVVMGEPLIARAQLDLSQLESPYCRITLTDEAGRRAWTNPIWLVDER
jgi:hypothetical protein